MLNLVVLAKFFYITFWWSCIPCCFWAVSKIFFRYQGKTKNFRYVIPCYYTKVLPAHNISNKIMFRYLVLKWFIMCQPNRLNWGPLTWTPVYQHDLKIKLSLKALLFGISVLHFCMYCDFWQQLNKFEVHGFFSVHLCPL